MNQTKILITGANGQLGRELTQFFNKDYEVNALSEYDLDITNFKKVKSAVISFHPDIIINAAAYTLVDDCETNIEIAYKVNALGVRNLSIIANSTGATLVHFSTDYVFNGEKSSPYTEFDIPKPLSIYGKSKYEGEKLLQKFHNRYFLIRISWLYSPYGNNFVKNILKLASQKKNLRIVNDQIGTPTFTKDVANQLKVLLNTEKYGLYHLTNQGECSWYDFSKKIIQLAKIKNVTLKPINSKELNQPAKRPKYSVLDNFIARIEGIDIMRSWEEALEDFILTKYIKGQS